MSKKFVKLAPLAFAACTAIALIIACGNGDIIKPDEGEIFKANGILGNYVKEEIISKQPNEPLSSSGEVQPGGSSGGQSSSSSSSSGGDPGNNQSSSSNNNPGSSSDNGQSSSSSSEESSSSQDPNAYQIPNFTCAWDPATVISGDPGDPSQAKITFTGDGAAAAETDCTKRVFYAWGATVATRDTMYWNANTDYVIKPGMQITGVKGGKTNLGAAPLSLATIPKVTCQSEGKPQSTRTGTACTLKVNNPPNPKVTGSITWNNLSYSSSSSKIFFTNAIPAYTTNLSVENGVESRCKTEDIRYDSTGFNSTGITITNPAAGDSVKVVAKCVPSGYTLFTAAAAVVPNPSLDGTCTWTSEDNTFVGGSTPAFATPKPTVQNSYGRCATDPVLSENGTSIYTALPNVNAGNSQKVNLKAYPACPAGTPYGTGIACPEITVINAADACKGKQRLSDFCPGVSWANVKWQAPTSANPHSGGCYYITGISSSGKINLNTDYRVNGTVKNSQIGSNDAVWNTKIDNGYYIYIQNGVYVEVDGLSSNGTPFCQSGTRTLTCGNVPSAGFTGTSVPAPSVVCNDGTSNPTVTFKSNNGSGTTINFNSLPAANTYNNIQASSTCGGSTAVTGSCTGSITVTALPSGNSALVFNGTDESSTLTDDTTYSILCSSTSLAVYCMDNANGVWSYSINGGTNTQCPVDNNNCNSKPAKVMEPCENGKTIKITGSSNVKCKNRNGWW